MSLFQTKALSCGYQDDAFPPDVVDIKFCLTSDDSLCKIKGCGLRVLKDSPAPEDDEINVTGHETERWGDSDEESLSFVFVGLACRVDSVTISNIKDEPHASLLDPHCHVFTNHTLVIFWSSLV